MILAYKKANIWNKSARGDFSMSLSRVKIIINWCIRSPVIHFEQHVHRCHLGSQRFGHFFFLVNKSRLPEAENHCKSVCVSVCLVAQPLFRLSV